MAKLRFSWNLFHEKYELRLGEFNNTTGTEGVKDDNLQYDILSLPFKSKYFK